MEQLKLFIERAKTDIGLMAKITALFIVALLMMSLAACSSATDVTAEDVQVAVNELGNKSSELSEDDLGMLLSRHLTETGRHHPLVNSTTAKAAN